MTALAGVLQLLIAIAFLSIPVIRRRYGADARASAEPEVERQGIPAQVLVENKIDFNERGIETAGPATIAAVLIVLALLNLAGNPMGETISWIVQPLVLLASLAILYSQLTAAKSVTAYLAKKGDETVRKLDVQAVLSAAEDGFPSWVYPQFVTARHIVALGGSVVVLVLLAIN